MICKICGVDFNIEKAERACNNCLIFGSCGLVKCPLCGYENPIKKGKKKNLKQKKIILEK